MKRVIAVLLSCAASLSAAQAYKRTTVRNRPDLPLFWEGRCFTYRLNAQGSPRTPGRTEEPAIDAAFSAWNAAAASCGNSWQFQKGPPATVAQTRLGVDRPAAFNQLIFRSVHCDDVVPEGDPCLEDPEVAHERCGNAYQCMYARPGVIGLTLTTFNVRTGRIRDADIEFNGAVQSTLFTTVDSPPCPSEAESRPSCVAYDIQNTLTHEVGHAMGFDHVVDPASTMAEFAPLGETSKRVIDQGTRQGFCDVYPPDPQQAACPMTEPGNVVGGCSVSPGIGVVALALVAAVGRRRRATT